LRAELAELRAVNAELRRGQVLLTEQVSIQQELIDTQRAAVQTLTGQVQALTEVRGLLEAENRLLRERVAEVERRLGQNPRNSDKPRPRARWPPGTPPPPRPASPSSMRR
jgi:peptidoglycan hydrolase CwlO-like protein